MRVLFGIIALVIVLIMRTDSLPGRKLPHKIRPPFTLGSPDAASPIIHGYSQNTNIIKDLAKHGPKKVSIQAEQCYEISTPSKTEVGNDVEDKKGEERTEGEDSSPFDPPLRGLEKTWKILSDNSHAGMKTGKLPPTLLRAMRQEAPPRRRPAHGHRGKIFTCPDADEIAPCLCDTLTMTINCSASGNFTEVKEIFNTATFPQTNFVTFLMRGMGHTAENETTLLNHTFGTVTFEEVLIESTQLREVEDDAFAGSEVTLRIIQMQHNSRLQIFPFQQMHQFSQLRELLLGFGSIQELPDLQNIAKLEMIYLNFNKIQTLKPKTFSQLPSLMVLDMGMNYLETIGPNAFMFSSADVLLYLDNNLISFIDNGAFSLDQPSLLDVSQNLLTTFEMAVFKPILDNIIDKGYNTYVDVRENPLCCSDILWVLNEPTYSGHIGLPDINCTTAVATKNRQHSGKH